MFCCDFDIGFISLRFFFRGSCLDWDCCVLVQLAASMVLLFAFRVWATLWLRALILPGWWTLGPLTIWLLTGPFLIQTRSPPILLPPSLEFRWETDLWPISKVVGQLPFLPRCIGGMVFWSSQMSFMSLLFGATCYPFPLLGRHTIKYLFSELKSYLLLLARVVWPGPFLGMACISCCSLPLSHLLQLWLMLPLQTTYLCNGIDGWITLVFVLSKN